MEQPLNKVADALPRHWADQLLPQALRPYARLMRLERPIGWWLLLLPGWWTLALQGGSWQLFALFFFGAIIMRGAGCVWNDITDRDFDAAVARTRLRPIPSGQVSVRQALLFLALLLGLGAIILWQMNSFTQILGAASLILIVTYPFMKRITWWPQAFLGLTFNWGALMGWTAVTGQLGATPLLLYVGGIFWTLAYDTIYAHQDKEDDALIGLKSTALKFGDQSIWWLAFFFALALALIDAAVWLAGGGIIAHVGIAAAAMQAAWQLARFQPDNGARCLELFRSNRIFGLIITLGFLLDSLLT